MPPSISSVSGAFVHKASVTITGTGFGTKSPGPGPVVWDDCDHTVNDKTKIITEGGWSDAWPNDASNGDWNMQYRATPYGGVSPPHSHVNKLMVGSAGDDPPARTAAQGLNTMVWKTRSTPTYPAYTYMSWWQQYDPNWVFGNGTPPDNNLKLTDWSDGNASPYDVNNWYLEYCTKPGDTNEVGSYGAVDNSGELGNPPLYCPGTTPTYTNPFGRWVKLEAYLKWGDQASGANAGGISLRENGAEKYSNCSTCDPGPRVGPTDQTTWNAGRVQSIGGFQRAFGANNRRFFCDLYLDHTWAHVAIGNASTIGACTRLEVQKPTAWSSTSITTTVNRGVYVASESAWLYVYGPGFDGDGYPEVNTTGFPIVFADAGATFRLPPAIWAS